MKKLVRLDIAIWIGIAIIVESWILWGLFGGAIAQYFLHGTKIDEAASWGDSFGPFNALISAVGFGGVLLTLAFQRKAMRHQQDESDSQAKEQHRQQFDRAFFELLGLMREVRSDIRYRYSPAYIVATKTENIKTTTGVTALTRAALEAAYWVRWEQGQKKTFLTSDELGEIYRKHVHRRYESWLGPYYRLIYTILRRISEDKVLSASEKAAYGNLLRSQLQSREVTLLALNSCTAMSNNFKDYIVEFRILKYLPSLVMIRTLRRAGFPLDAFTARD